MGRPPLCILSDSSFYTFHRSSKGENLWHFLHQRLPNQFPNSKFVFPFSFILAALDCLIKNEKLFDETNWEVICLPECSELFFRSRFLHISELEYEIRQCLFIHQLAPPKDPQRIEASWTIEARPLPFLQRLLASDFILDALNQYYISSELTRFFHGKHFSRYYLNRKFLPGFRVAELFQRHLDCGELQAYPKNNSIIFFARVVPYHSYVGLKHYMFLNWTDFLRHIAISSKLFPPIIVNIVVAFYKQLVF